MLYLLALAAFGACLAYLAMEDAVFFEIKLELLPLLLLCSLAITQHLSMPLWDRVLGALLWGLPITVLYWFKSGSIGRGDLFLLASAGFFFGIKDAMPSVVVFAAATALTAFIYARRRGKAFGKSSIPAAIPVTVTLLIDLMRHLYAAPPSYTPITTFEALAAWVPMVLPLLGGVMGATIWLLHQTPRSNIFRDD